MTVRSVFFWTHLVAGVLAGTIILIMSVTGVLLTYEKQMVAWADSGRPLAAAAGPRLSIEQLIARVADAHDGTRPGSVVVPSAAGAPALATVRQTVFVVDPHTGQTLGESAPKLRQFFHVVTDWHRWLAVHGTGRSTARAVTGWSNLLFLFMVLSGIYLWWPRRWTVRHVKAVTVFNGRLSGRARDFNWHNVIGFWCAVPLFFVVISAAPISFPWASALVYRLVGEAPPAQAGPPRGGRPGGGAGAPGQPDRAEAVSLAGLDAAWQHAERQVDDWRTITFRLPAGDRAPFVFTIDRGGAGQPQYRGTLTVPRGDGDTARWEPFESQSAGRRLRSYLRFLHTGEALGLAGQTVAGLASLGGAFLVYTGLALSYRRFFRRSREEPAREDVAA